jgi:hypothetical protein
MPSPSLTPPRCSRGLNLSSGELRYRPPFGWQRRPIGGSTRNATVTVKQGAR